VTVAVAFNHNPGAINLLVTLGREQFHRHLGPDRNRVAVGELNSVLTEADRARGQGKARLFQLDIEWFKNSRGIKFTRTHSRTIQPITRLSIVNDLTAAARVPSPFDDGGPPGQAGAEHDEQDQISAIHTASLNRLVQRDRHRRR
jgi:hypothetical protein